MIQRIQSIFLLLSSGAFFSLFGLPFATSDQTDTQLFSDKVYDISDNPILLMMVLLGGGIALFNIFMFKSRKTQMRLDYIIATIGILLLILIVFFVYQSGIMDKTSIEIQENYFGLAMPLLAIIFALVANRFIKKDDKLVKSMDRLR